MRFRLVLAAFAVLLVGLSVPSASHAQDDPGSTSTTVLVREGDSPVGDIVPQPNSGQAPDSPNDPGGWQQYLVFAAIVAGLAAIVLLVRRESQRARASRSS